MDRRVNVDLTLRVGGNLTDEEVARVVEAAVTELREHGQPIRSARVRRASTEMTYS